MHEKTRQTNFTTTLIYFHLNQEYIGVTCTICDLYRLEIEHIEELVKREENDYEDVMKKCIRTGGPNHAGLFLNVNIGKPDIPDNVNNVSKFGVGMNF